MTNVHRITRLSVSLQVTATIIYNVTTMSHGHTHGPGQSCSHSDVPQSPVMPTPDPALQALIDQDFIPVPIALSSDAHAALCARHRLEKCDPCNVNFANTNRLAQLLVQNPNLLCPPPNNVVTQKLTQMVVSTKDDGNVRLSSPPFPTTHLTIEIEPVQSRPRTTGTNALHCRCPTRRAETSMGSKWPHA